MEPGEFGGTIGRWYWESEQWWPEPTRAGADAPNVVIALLDDVGFAQLGPYGSDIETPTFERLASGGLTFTNFHTTALCSPTRACVLTGRNHHSVGMGRIIDLATGFPGYDGRILPSHGFISEILNMHGYNTFGLGKWHLSVATEETMAGPFDTWPSRRGFERFYGFMPGETDQWYPDLISDNHAVDPPASPEEGYHFSADIADTAIRLAKALRPVIDPFGSLLELLERLERAYAASGRAALSPTSWEHEVSES